MKPTLLLLSSLLTCNAALALDDATSFGQLTMVVGNDMTTSDEIVPGNDWLSLHCDPSGCRLLPATVAVGGEEPSTRDSMNMTLHRLHFANAGPEGTTGVEVWLRRNSRFPWLKPGPVLTYTATEGPVDGVADLATKSVSVPLADRTVTLMPLLDIEHRQIPLQLREPKQRQMLDDMTACLVATGYLRWSGDLDGDGRPDYLIDYPRGSAGTHSVLYLSTMASPSQLVGSSAVFDSTVGFNGCDDSEWFGSE
ncbi:MULTISPECIES: hypothetical protein [unclassified Pseudomonas]|uniref:hypothetical protein n=1 Tax=unclassified Pseudomonas TaxID=196821 RepID=UPI00200C7743|nr:MULTISPECIES: hypothetical protein [unclassified Pseudomonas]